MDELDFDIGDLRVVRELVARRAAEAGMDGRVDDLVIAVSELAANSIRHGGGAGRLRVWEEDGAVLCEVSDAGRIVDPEVGRARPSLDAAAGRGIWLVRQLCDEVEISSGEAGTTVRVRVG